MDREERDLFVFPKRVLRSVSVVHIPINDEHAIEIMFGDGVSRRDRNIVKQAKTHRTFRYCVMTRRSNQTNCVRNTLLFHHARNRVA